MESWGAGRGGRQEQGLDNVAQILEETQRSALSSFSSSDMQPHDSGWSVCISHKPQKDKWSLFSQVTTAKRKVFFKCISPSALSPIGHLKLDLSKLFTQHPHTVIQMWHI